MPGHHRKSTRRRKLRPTAACPKCVTCGEREADGTCDSCANPICGPCAVAGPDGNTVLCPACDGV